MSDSNPTDGHRHTPRLSLTPRLYERIQALGFVPGSAGVLSWLVEYAEELRRTIDALQGRPEGGADLGFALSSAGWVRAEGEADQYGVPLDLIVVTDDPGCGAPKGLPFRRTQYRTGREVAASYHPDPRAAMRGDKARA